MVVREIGFLQQIVEEPQEMNKNGDDVGRIDNVLVHPDLESLRWCALEIQAVYFSGSSMAKEFKAIAASQTDELLFPAAQRRPDFRSSGPKRLMPQLQTKVPTLRRWGKKMGVIVDRAFFDAMGKMDDVKDPSNCDIAWFVVTYDDRGYHATLRPDFVRFTTLERAVEGLTGGGPVTLAQFEEQIRRKLAS